MTTFVVSYTLKRPGQDYETLWDELGRLDGQRALEALWLVNVNNTAKEVHDHLKGYVDANDRLWVSELTAKRAVTNAIVGTSDWLRNNPPDR